VTANGASANQQPGTWCQQPKPERPNPGDLTPVAVTRHLKMNYPSQSSGLRFPFAVLF